MPGIDRYMTRDLVGLDGAATCREAARLMAEKRIGAVAVNERGSTLGLVTERDLIYNILLAGRETCEFPISQAMRRDLPVVSPSVSETDCAEMMRVYFTRHLLVADKGQILGIISMRDVIRLMLDEKQWLIDQLQIYIRGR